jgi:hypothetical protein
MVENGTQVRTSLALILARIIVPGWLLAGAILKWMDGSPSNLPVTLVKGLGGLGIDLLFVLQFSIAVELTVAGVMWLLPRLARPVGIAMLAAFLPVLVADVFMGAASCGCFGAVKMHPGITMTMDLMFLLGLWFFGKRVPSLQMTDSQPTWRVVAAGAVTLVSFAVAFGPKAPGVSASNSSTVRDVAALPAEGYYVPEYQEWLGQPWSEVPITAWIDGASADVVKGISYVLFYRKDCEHCHELMGVFFNGPLTWPTTAVAVPEREGFPTEGVLPFVCDECSTAELPAGVDWFMSTPVLVRLVDGVVDCAAEVTAATPMCID